MTPSDYGIAVGQRWEFMVGEIVTVTAVHDAGICPIEFVWDGMVATAQSALEDFLNAFRPVDLRSYLEALVMRERAASRKGRHMTAIDLCLGCGKDLLPENRVMADGCPCNSPRGVNHGRVPRDVCTCEKCDPEQTGSSRFRPERAVSKKEGT